MTTDPHTNEYPSVDAVRWLGRFTTQETLHYPDGSLRVWQSRLARKRSEFAGPANGVLWQPRTISWWIAILFATGAALFAVGSLPVYFNNVGAHRVGVTFFAGSVFFTSAALLQLQEALAAVPRPSRRFGRSRDGIDPYRIDIWSTGIQLLGTIFFNISTFAAMILTLSVIRQNQFVWAPDVLGSIAFLMASYLAYVEVCHRGWCWNPKGVAGHIARFNMAGSVAFGVSAVAAHVLPSTGMQANPVVATVGTLVGALCFLTGAALLIPEQVTLIESGSVASHGSGTSAR